MPKTDPLNICMGCNRPQSECVCEGEGLAARVQELADEFRGDGYGPHFASSACKPGCPACGYLGMYHEIIDSLASASRMREALKRGSAELWKAELEATGGYSPATFNFVMERVVDARAALELGRG